MATEEGTEVSAENGGYNEELHRGLGLFGTLSTSFAQQGVMASTALLFTYGLSNGGPAVLLYVWIIGSVLSCIVGICLAEICSKYPYAGSVYNWAGEMTTKEKAPITKYATGWLNFLGNAFSSVGYSFGFGQFVASLYDLRQAASFTGTDDSMRPAPLSLGMQVLIAMLGTTLMAAVNVIRIDMQAWMNMANFVFSLGSLLAICISLMVSSGPKQTLYWAFTTTYNASGFNDFGYVILTATLTLLFGVAGYEASAHLAEETVNPRICAPWGMVFNIFTTCVVGFIFLLILLLNTGDDIDSVINTQYGNATIGVFVNSVGLNNAVPLTALIVIISYMAGLANMTITARIGWAMARDGSFPCSPWLRKINPVTKSPVNMVLAILIFDYILLLIPLGSTLAFSAISSISTIGYQASYAIPIVLRLTSGIFVADPHFNLGAFSLPLHALSAVFLIVTGSFMFLPSATPIAIINFQWAIVVAPTFAMIGVVYWFMFARKALEGSGKTTEKTEKDCETPAE